MRLNKRCLITVLLVCLGAVVPGAAHAQQRPPQTPAKPAPAKPAPAKPKKPKKPRPPIFLTLGASVQVSGNSTTQTLSFPLYGETATVTGPVAFGITPAIDFGLGVQLRKRFSLGAGVSLSRGTGHLDADFSVPHPLVFGANRTAEGSAPAHHSAFNVDIDLAVVLVAGKTWRIEVVGGPTLSWASQQLAIDSLTIVEGDYPYDTVSLQALDSAGHSDAGFGVHIGSRLTWQLNRRTGVTMGVRWRSSAFHPEVEGEAQALGTNGVHVGGAIKFVF